MTEMNRRKFLGVMLLSALTLALSGCDSDQMTLDEMLAMLRAYLDEQKEDDEEDEEGSETVGKVTIALTYPAGRSPNVFTSGWVFGARCTSDGKDISDSVNWSGTGSFNPPVGRMSRPVFSSEGANQITISVDVGGKKIQKSVNINAVSPAGYAAMGMMSFCEADAHGCPACPHPVKGPITSGSPNVFVNGKPAARVGDVGIHAPCCGPNSYKIVGGDSSVLINGRSAAKIGGATQHCGGMGHITGGSA